MSELANVKGFLAVLVDPEDFELADSIAGTLAVEVRQDDDIKYTARIGMLEAIDMAPSAKQETFGLHINESAEAGRITIDGKAGTIDGQLGLDELKFTTPYQSIVDLFHDDEGKNVNVCSTDGDGNEICKDEWQEGTDAPEVEGTFIASVPSISGALSFDAKEDAFQFADMSLGESSTTLMIDDASLLSVDMNAKDGYAMSASIGGTIYESITLQLTPYP